MAANKSTNNADKSMLRFSHTHDAPLSKHHLHNDVERNALIIATIANAGMGLAGLAVFLITNIQALLLDAAFTIIAVLSGLISIIVASTSQHKSKRYPYGRYALESMFTLAKSALIIALMFYTLWQVSIKAYRYFTLGIGEAMNIGPVIVYEIIMVSCGAILYAYFRKCNRNLHFTSALLIVEGTNIRIDALMSAGIGLAAIIVSQIPVHSPFSFLLYTGDFFITLGLTAATIKDPVVLCHQAWVELTNGTAPCDERMHTIRDTVNHIMPITLPDHAVTVFRQGKGMRIVIALNGLDTVNPMQLQVLAQHIRQALVRTQGHPIVEFVVASDN